MATNKSEFLTSEVGAPIIRAPEFTESDRIKTAAVDVWAFGLMMHSLIFKNLPKGVDYTLNVLDEPYVVPDDPPTSTAYKKMLKACLKKNPEDRITTEELK